MAISWNPREHASLAKYVVRWLIIGGIVACVVGSACAAFLWLLDVATQTQWHYPALLFFLPLGGLGVGLLYHWLGRSVEGGNNLIVEEIHEPGGGVPGRMAPLVLIGTVVTHLLGGSAGREGTAVQMGGSIASTFSRWMRLDADDSRTLMMAGVAAGFGAVFGTPLTGAVFAMEVLAVGRMSYEAIVPCLVASIIGDWACGAWGVRHTRYHIGSFPELALVHTVPHLDWSLAGKVALAAIVFGLASVLFAELAHGLHKAFKVVVPWPMFRPVLGGVIIIGLVYALGTRDYLGLGVTSPDPHAVTILSSFAGGAHTWSWWWKILFTAVTLASGFKGGEVTPLFYVGATLGSVLAGVMHAPVDLFAGLGFVAVFAGATNTPLACTIMGIELFGSSHVIYFALACFLSYLFSGHSGIYLSQKIGTPKLDSPHIPPDASIRDVRDIQQLRPSILRDRLARLDTPDHPDIDDGGLDMAMKHKVTTKEIGQVRIYMTPREKRKAKSFRERLQIKPLFREIIDAAKRDGILNATAHHTHYGYSGSGKVQWDLSEIPNPDLNLCVELIAPRTQLEDFCRHHGDILKDKVIVYKHMEHWDLSHETIEVVDAAVEELDADVVDDVEL